MPRITSIEPQKKNPHRFNIYLDGKFTFGADEDTVVARRLIVGKEIPEEDLPKVLYDTEVGKLLDRLYSLFSIRQRSEREVREYLKRLSFKRKVKGGEEENISETVIDDLIERLKVKNLVNDLEFARNWVEARRNSKNKGLIALKSELFQKGIDREIIDEVLSDEHSEEDEEKLATNALSKKLNSFSRLEEKEFKTKGLEYLMRRGFNYQLSREVVEKLAKIR